MTRSVFMLTLIVLSGLSRADVIQSIGQFKAWMSSHNFAVDKRPLDIYTTLRMLYFQKHKKYVSTSDNMYFLPLKTSAIQEISQQPPGLIYQALCDASGNKFLRNTVIMIYMMMKYHFHQLCLTHPIALYVLTKTNGVIFIYIHENAAGTVVIDSSTPETIDEMTASVGPIVLLLDEFNERFYRIYEVTPGTAGGAPGLSWSKFVENPYNFIYPDSLVFVLFLTVLLTFWMYSQ